MRKTTPFQGLHGAQCWHPFRHWTQLPGMVTHMEIRPPPREFSGHGHQTMIVSSGHGWRPLTHYSWWPRAITGVRRLLSQSPGLGCVPGMTSHHRDPSISEWHRSGPHPQNIRLAYKVKTHLLWDSLTLWLRTQSVTGYLAIRMGNWT